MADSKFEYVPGARAEPSKTALFDVVFLHGLTGNHFDTWRHENGEFWPSWVALDFPDVNVYSAGYTSSVAASLVKGAGASLADRATILLDRLASRVAPDRPTVFITHSLGGLIVKQMLRKSDGASNERRKRVCRQARGVVFIATPHAGSQVAGVVNSLVRIATTKSVHELDYKADALLDLSQWFSNWANERKLPVECFYEIEKYKGALVVDQLTANPNVSGCDPIAVQADHESISKLENRDAQVYCSIRAFLSELQQSLADQDGRPPEVTTENDEISSEYAAYTTQAATDRRSLADKLRAAGRAHEIDRAEGQKERFAMTLQRHIAQPSAVRRLTRLMSNVDTRFHRHVTPLLIAGDENHKVDLVLQEAVLDPSLQALESDGGDATAKLVDSALYYLAGNCHLRFDHG